MILKNNKIIIVLNVIMLLIVTGLSTYAYHKQKSYSNQKIEINNSPVDNTKNSKIALITNSSTNFKNENDLNKKFEIFKKLINDKNEILDSKDDEISSKYNDTISQMKEELKSSIKNTIKENTLDSQALSDAQKVESSKNKLDPIKIWTDYTSGKQIYQQLAIKYQCSVRTIQRYIDKAPKTSLNQPKNRYLNIIMDTTFFHRYSGVLVMMDSKTDKVVSYHFVRTEKDIYYKLALNRLREKGYIIQSITCDGRRGLMKELFNTPVQMCQFHMVSIVMRKLRKKHQSQAGKELKIIAKSLVKSSKNDFYRRLYCWFIKHVDFLK